MKEPDWKQVGEDVANDWRGSGDDLGSVIARHLPAAYALGKSHGPEWLPIEDEPRDEHLPYDARPLWMLYAPAAEGLSELVTLCRYHDDGGWCICELRQATHYAPYKPPEPKS